VSLVSNVLGELSSEPAVLLTPERWEQGRVSSAGEASAGEWPWRFHASMPGYKPTRLVAAPMSARRLGVQSVYVKDESSRFGLDSFKVLGASWAIARAIDDLIKPPGGVRTFRDLVAAARRMGGFSLAAATDGNHGRAVAFIARELGLRARIYVPAGTAVARITAIEEQGADVISVEGGYGAAVARSAQDASNRCLVISDTSWPGYEDIPRWVIEGYSTLFVEVSRALEEDRRAAPTVVALPIGVGALAAAGVQHFRTARSRPLVVGVEPTSAACVLGSLLAGNPIKLDRPQDSIMAGLNCDAPSLVAWPVISRGLDCSLTVSDDRVPEAMRLLATDGIVAGETGAAGFAGLLRVRDGMPDLSSMFLQPDSSVLLISTEGATDPAEYDRLTQLGP
jgi:diaminopropionate ammonia-lyase